MALRAKLKMAVSVSSGFSAFHTTHISESNIRRIKIIGAIAGTTAPSRMSGPLGCQEGSANGRTAMNTIATICSEILKAPCVLRFCTSWLNKLLHQVKRRPIIPALETARFFYHQEKTRE